MRSPSLRILVLSPLLVLAACFSEKVSSSADPRADFSALTTYAFLTKKSSAPQDPRFDNDVVNARVRRAAGAALRQKGYTPGASGAADFLVAWRITTADIAGDNDIPDWWGYYPIAWGGVGFYASEVQEGTLIIDVVDSKTNKLIWRGVGERQVDPDIGPERRLKRIGDGVTKILASFPER